MSHAYRLLAMGDNHGNAEALRRVVDDIEDDTFDYVVHTGDFTNLFFDGYPKAQEQLEKMKPYLDTLSVRGEFLYVFGNRDERHLDRLKPSDLPFGAKVPSEGVTEVGGIAFTQQMSAGVETNLPVVRVTHGWKATPPEFEGLLSLSGDTHNGRYINNIVDTGFLYRTNDWGADEVYGGYSVIEVEENGEVDVEFRSIGNVKIQECRRHQLLGEKFMVPSSWQKACKFCYEEDKYYDELERAVLNQSGAEEDSTDITNGMLDAVEDRFPRPFRDEERAVLIDNDEDSEQTGLDAF